MKFFKYSFLFLFLLSATTVVAQGKKEKNDKSDKFNELKSIEIYSNVLRELDMNYVDKLNYDDLLNFALDGMLYSLDPYTVFIPEAKNEVIRSLNRGEYMGIGVVIQKIDGEVQATKVLQNMPADKAGIIPGDVLISINGKKCSSMKLDEVSDMLRGTSKEKLTIKIKRYGSNKTIVKEVTRDYVSETSVPLALEVAPKVGYIKISSFVTNTSSLFKSSLDSLVNKNGIESLIIDLRDNGGGILQQAVEIASLFVPKGTKIVDLKTNDVNKTKFFYTINNPSYPKMKIAFIVNSETASTSELLAGSFQDLDRAIILGERSFGKGLVQNVISLGYDTYLKLTIGKYMLPSGRNVQAIDYTSRHKGDKDRVLADSLLNEYKTKNGRIVYDGSGITPDSSFTLDNSLTICDYLQYYNIFYKYVNKYHHEHKTIDSPDKFTISDSVYDDFSNFVISQKFNYSLTSNIYLQDLEELIKTEGYEDIAKEHIEKLKEALKPNIPNDLQRLKPKIKEMLEKEIVSRYYYSKGIMEYSLRNDSWINSTINILNQGDLYKQLLRP